MKCANCNAELIPGDRFCGECGRPVPVTVASSPPPQQIEDTAAQPSQPRTDAIPTVLPPTVASPNRSPLWIIGIGVAVCVVGAVVFALLPQFREHQGQAPLPEKEVVAATQQAEPPSPPSAETTSGTEASGKQAAALPAAEIAKVQRLLQDLGYNPGPADGRPGAKTRAAIEQFQRAASLPIDGKLTQALHARLQKEAAAGARQPEDQPRLARIHSENPTKRAAATPASPAVIPAAPATSPAAPSLASADLAFWNAIKDSTDPADFEAYLKQFPKGTFAALVQRRLKALKGSQAKATEDKTSQEKPATVSGDKNYGGKARASYEAKNKPVIGDCDSFDGHWDTSYGPLTIDMDGNRATGTYQYYSDPGTVVGSVSLNILEGEWMQTDHSKGWLRFELSADRKSFSGVWGYENEGVFDSWIGECSSVANAKEH